MQPLRQITGRVDVRLDYYINHLDRKSHTCATERTLQSLQNLITAMEACMFDAEKALPLYPKSYKDKAKRLSDTSMKTIELLKTLEIASAETTIHICLRQATAFHARILDLIQTTQF